MITRTHRLLTHTPFFRPIMSKKRALHLFLKITFFCPLLLLLTPETLPNHLFRQTNHQKWSKNLPKGGKIFFSFFCNFLSHFLSPLTEKNKTTYFFRPFYHRKYENRKRKRPCKKIFFLFFFFDFFSTLPLLVIGKITTYLFFRNSNLKCPKMPLSPLKFHFLQITFFPP